jgi:hypothetical protein
MATFPTVNYRLLHNKATPDSITKECCWTISNLTAGPVLHIQSVIDSGLMPPLLKVLNDGDWKCKREATWAVANATSGGTVEQIKYLIDCGYVHPSHLRWPGSPGAKRNAGLHPCGSGRTLCRLDLPVV